ncbi:MAG: ParB/RepB/Spo0J family partition protein [Leptospiraceae bacterium]|nr:ParB/RepB/Spo0J family partition protein [Leptospiraceae bacterium]MDW8307692.1 ParB/RepB/Spo0J family partition protein [Leptospiraceae bacterium]
MASKTKKLSIAADIFEKNLEGVIRKIPLSEIVPSTDQPRQNRDINIEALAESMAKEGLLQPIVVTKEESKYVIIAGERRYRAATLLGWQEIECRILHRDSREKYKLAVIENLQRENLDPYEEALAYKKLKEQFHYTDAELASILGKSRNYINEILSVADIPPEIQTEAREVGIDNKNLLIQLAQAVKQNNAHEFLRAFREGTLRTVKAAKEFNRQKRKQKESQSQTQLPTEKTKVEFSLRLSWQENGQLHLEGVVSGLSQDIPLEKLQKEWLGALQQVLDHLS